MLSIFTDRSVASALRHGLRLWRSDLSRSRLSLGRWLALVQLQLESSNGRRRPDAWSKRLPGLLRHLFPGERLHTACMETARLLLELQDPVLAAAALAPLEERWRALPCLALLRGEVLRHAGQLEAAGVALQVALQDPSLLAPTACQLGELERQRGRFDAAAQWFLQSIATDPSLHWAHQALQFTPFSASLLPAILECYAALSSRHPRESLLLQLHSHYLLQSGQSEPAIAAARRAARLDLGPRRAWLARADATPEPPDLLILGVPKGGTTSLHSWLHTHPQLWMHPRKELNFFDQHWRHGCRWYAAQFPRFRRGSGLLRAESSPNYWQHPLVPERVQALMPRARLIVLLRDPLQRAISWTQHLQRHNGLQGDLETLMLAEANALEAMGTGPLPAPGPGRPNALLGSCYDAPLQRWQALFPPEQLLVLRSEALFAEPGTALEQVAAFLGVSSPWATGPLQAWNRSPTAPAPLSSASRARLQAVLAPHNRCSAALLGVLPMGDWPPPAPHQP